MSFQTDLLRFAEKAQRRTRDVFVGSVNHVHDSVVNGSPVTGAPGQPVDTGALKASWTPDFLEQWVWQTTTGVEYAPGIEDGIGPHGPITLRSEVGGFHSVALTRAAWERIVEAERRRVTG